MSLALAVTICSLCSNIYLSYKTDVTLLTCTSLALMFILVHARFVLQLQQSGILSLLLFVHLKP